MAMAGYSPSQPRGDATRDTNTERPNYSGSDRRHTHRPQLLIATQDKRPILPGEVYFARYADVRYIVKRQSLSCVPETPVHLPSSRGLPKDFDRLYLRSSDPPPNCGSGACRSLRAPCYVQKGIDYATHDLRIRTHPDDGPRLRP